jgi:hypothetical protein
MFVLSIPETRERALSDAGIGRAAQSQHFLESVSTSARLDSCTIR